MNKITKMESYQSKEESVTRNRRLELFNSCPIEGEDILNNIGLFINSKNLSRILFFDQIYRMILDTQGIIMEFGTRWGQNISLFSALRGIYEPFNRLRSIIGFDTFTGLTRITSKDAGGSFHEGALAVSHGYERYLEEIMQVQEDDNPLGHIKKFEIIKGDASNTLREYLDRHPETIVALAWFDMDIYEPTKNCLELVKKRLVRGSVVGFDELNDPLTPGETTALSETIGLNNIRLKRSRYASRVSYFVV